MTTAVPSDEGLRLAALRRYRILDSGGDAVFDRLVADMAAEFAVPVAGISFVEGHRQWFKASTGLGVSEHPRAVSFCAHALAREEPLVVRDARLDIRFARNPLVTGRPRIRFYAGARLLDHDGFALGAACVIGAVPRPEGLTTEDLARLSDYARRAMAHTHLHRLRAEWCDGLPALMLARATLAERARAHREAERLVDLAYAAAERREG